MRKRNIKTASEAIQYAIDYQNWASEQNLSYSELVEWNEVFTKLGKRFLLTTEFKENGII